MPELHRRSIRTRLVDAPGRLEEVTRVLADVGVNISRLEVVSPEDAEVWDDIEVTAPDERRLDDAVAALKGLSIEVITLPASWVMRDWSLEVLEALEALAGCRRSSDAQRLFVEAAATLSQTQQGFVLLEQASPNVDAALERWGMLRDVAITFDPDDVDWHGPIEGREAAVSAMRPARGSGEAGGVPSVTAVGAVVHCPLPGRPGAWLAVVGQRPPFLDPELTRLELFARVGAPHLVLDRWEVPA